MTTPNLQLPEVPVAILDSSDELNDGFWALDAVVQLTVQDRTHTVVTLPTAATQGTRYLIASGPRAGHIAYRSPNGWAYYVPRPGWLAWSLEDEALFVFRSGAWTPFTGSGSGNNRVIGATWVRNGDEIVLPVNDVYVRVPADLRIVRATVMTIGGPGSCAIDVWRDTAANFPPTSSDSIVGGNLLEIDAGQYLETEFLDGWSLELTQGDIVAFHLEESDSFELVTVILDAELR